MQRLIFKIASPRKQVPTMPGPTLVLEQDMWNDYSFQTQYHLSYHAATPDGNVDARLIGAVKILRRGQTSADGLQLNEDFPSLDENFCSVGQSLDYYERLRELGEVGRHIMKALRDVVALPELIEQFRDEEGWGISLFRDQKDKGNRFRFLATGLVNGHYEKAPEDQQSFTFSMSGWESPLVVNTISGESATLWSPKTLPERVNILVGRNGSGKSTLLARLARVAFGSPSERAAPPLRDLGKLEPEGIGFLRVVTVAFSPFDSFKLPGSDDKIGSRLPRICSEVLGDLASLASGILSRRPFKRKQKISRLNR